MKFKMKDIITLSLMTVLYLVLAMLSKFSSIVLGIFGDIVSPGVWSLFTGTIIYFVAYKVHRPYQCTYIVVLLMLAFTLMGGGYIPWWITSITSAIIADLIMSRSDHPSTLKVALGNGIMAIGLAWGGIIPAVFFAHAYRTEWIARGVPAAQMDMIIQYSSGLYALGATIVCFVLGFIGAYIGYAILKKHFQAASK